MTNLIYQYWKGPLKSGVLASTKLMKEYADRIGAEYRFDHNVTIASKTVNIDIYYEPANPLVDASFDQYDKVALIDIDVFPVEGLTESLFDQVTDEDAGICTEPLQPMLRELYNVAGINSPTDKRWTEVLKSRWNIDYSYDDKNRPLVYNTGVVVLTKDGIQKIRKTWPSFQEYVNAMQGFPRFYSFFQDYFSAFIHHKDFKFTSMHNGWNSYMHKVGSHPNARVSDTRTDETKLVHIMFRTADDWPEDALWRITNKPIEEWNLPVNPRWPND